MEHVESLTLAERLAQLPAPDRLTDPTVVHCMRDVAAALDHAHGRGVVHGDLKAANVLLRTGDGRALLGDFAIAAAGRVPAATAAGDVRAFAALLHEVATGSPPYGGELAAIGGHPDRPPPPLGLTAPDLPRDLEAVLSRGLSAPPRAGYGTAGELAAAYLEAVERLPSGAALAVSRPPAPVPAAPRRRRRGPTARVVAPAAVLLFGTVILTLVAPPPTAEGRDSLPAPVAGALGRPVAVGGLRLTVLGAALDAQPPASVRLRPGDRFVLVQVAYQADGRGGTIASPYDWALTDASGAAYAVAQDGIDGALPEAELGPAGTARGRLGFVVRRAARGLVLQFDSELGDDAARFPLG
jgi:hypothetical protein